MAIKRVILALAIAMTLATTASATLPPTESGQGPWACYRVLTYWDAWYFIGYYWEDESCSFPWCFDNIICFYRY